MCCSLDLRNKLRKELGMNTGGKGMTLISAAWDSLVFTRQPDDGGASALPDSVVKPSPAVCLVCVLLFLRKDAKASSSTNGCKPLLPTSPANFSRLLLHLPTSPAVRALLHRLPTFESKSRKSNFTCQRLLPALRDVPTCPVLLHLPTSPANYPNDTS